MTEQPEWQKAVERVKAERESKGLDRETGQSIEEKRSNRALQVVFVVGLLLLILFCTPWLLKTCSSGNTMSIPVTEADLAYRFCDKLMATSLPGDCKIGTAEILLWVDTNSAEARKMCGELSRQVSGSFRSGNWKLKIISPYSGKNALATCQMR